MNEIRAKLFFIQPVHVRLTELEKKNNYITFELRSVTVLLEPGVPFLASSVCIKPLKYE